MSDDTRKVCPDCNGNKEIDGKCVCDSEWRGNKAGDDWEDCQCTPNITCPTCNGTGYISEKA